MSQQQISSYFKTTRRCLPDQQAAKRRKVVLESHQIEELLDTENEESEVEEEFDDDEDWESLANKTLDEMEATEIMTSVTTSACDDHVMSGSNDRGNTVIMSQPAEDQAKEKSKLDYESMIKTPKSSASTRVDKVRLSKTDDRGVRWTPPSGAQPLFTIGTWDKVIQAKKRLNWSEQKKRNVVFTKLSSLVPRKVSKPTLDYDALNVKLTPKLHSIWELQDLTSSVPKPRELTSSVPKPHDLTSSVPKPRELTSSVPKPRELTSSVPKPHDLTSSVPKPQDLTSSVPKPHDLTSSVPKPRELTSSVPKPQDLTSSVPKPHDLTSSVPKPRELTSSVPKPHDLTSRVPKPQDLTPSVPKSRDLTSNVPKPRDLTSAIADAKRLEKKVTPAQIKSKLGKAKLKDLRSLLSDIEGTNLRAERVRNTVSAFKSPVKADILLEIDLAPVPTPRTPVKSMGTPARASPRKVPAFQRYHSLSQPVNRTLPLPITYARLQETFRSTDTIVSMMFNRKERITLEKLARHTTDLMNKKWTVEMLQKMIVVFPQAYNIRWRTRQDYTKALELVVEPNMNYKRDLKNLFESEETEPRLMTSSLLVERRDMFRNSLVEIVKDHHEQFLASLDPPIEADRSRLTKWHKDFDVDLLPDVDVAELPPNPQEITPVTPSKNQDLASLNPRLGQILTDIDNGNVKPAPGGHFLQSPSKTACSPSKKILEGVNPELVARVRAKEAARAKLEMTRTPSQLARISTLRKLPNLARVLRSLFAVEKKAALTVQFTCKKISESLGQDEREVERQLRSLSAETDGWLTCCKVAANEYFKTEKTDVNTICKRLQRKLDEALEN